MKKFCYYAIYNIICRKFVCIINYVDGKISCSHYTDKVVDVMCEDKKYVTKMCIELNKESGAFEVVEIIRRV